MDKIITQQQVEQLAKEFGLTSALVWTVIDTECSGRGFASDGRIKIQHEPHDFAKRLDKLGIDNELKMVGRSANGLKIYEVTANGITYRNGVDVHSKEWAAYEVAKSIHLEAANESTSFGMGQVMGFNYRLASGKDKFKSAQEMIEAFSTGEYAQVRGMLWYCANCGIIDDLLRHDWHGFAWVYNGTGYLAQGYHTKLSENFARRSK